MSYSPAIRVALVMMMVLSAGCNGIFPGGTVSPSSDDTTSSTENPDLPPGITPSGVSEPFRLAQAHVQALNGSFTVRERTQVRFANGTTYSDSIRTTRVATDDSRYLYNSTTRGSSKDFLGGTNGTLIAYSNGTAVIRKIHFGGNTSYNFYRDESGNLVSPRSVFHGTPRNDERISVVFGTLSNVSVTRKNDSIVELRASSIEDDSIEVNGITVSNVTLSVFNATVQSNGLVREYRFVLQGKLAGNDVTVTEEVGYTDMGTTKVERPDWYDEAVDNATEIKR